MAGSDIVKGLVERFEQHRDSYRSGGVSIIASERVAYFNGSAETSFAEMTGLPKEQLTTSYPFP